MQSKQAKNVYENQRENRKEQNELWMHYKMIDLFSRKLGFILMLSLGNITETLDWAVI